MVGISDADFRKDPDIVIQSSKNFNMKLHTERLLDIVIKKPPIYRPIKRLRYNRHIKFILKQRPDTLFGYVHNILSFFLLKSVRRIVEQEISLIGMSSDMKSTQSKTRQGLISAYRLRRLGQAITGGS